MKKIDLESISAEVPVPSAIFYLRDLDSVLVVGTNNKERFGSDTFSTALAAKKVKLNNQLSQLRRQLWLFDDDDNNENKAIKDMWPQAARFDEQNQCAVAAAVQGTSYFGLSPSWNALVVSKFDKEGSQITSKTIDFDSISSAYSSEVVGSNYFIHCQLNQFDGRYAVFQLDKNLNQIGLQYFGYRPSRQTNPELFGPEIDVTKATLGDGSILQLKGNSIDVLTRTPTQTPTQTPTRLPTNSQTNSWSPSSFIPSNEPSAPPSFQPSAIGSILPTNPTLPSPNRPSQNFGFNEILGASCGGFILLAITALYFLRRRLSGAERNEERDSIELATAPTKYQEVAQNDNSAREDLEEPSAPMEYQEVAQNESEIPTGSNSKLNELIEQANHLLEDKENFCCPISMELMNDPVLTSVGRSYQRAAIEEWLNVNATDPLTRESLENNQKLIRNLNLREEIREFVTSTMTKSLDLAEKFFEIGDVEYGRKMISRIENLIKKFPDVSQDFSEKFERIRNSTPSGSFQNLDNSAIVNSAQNSNTQSL